jgi:regulator of sigma E protease
LITILATVIVLGVLIFVHELGHFLTAKAVDIEVPRFSIGFGPRVIGFRRGETEYVISALPLGGYVKMAGMEEMEAIEGGDATLTEMVEHKKPQHVARPRDFESKPIWARTLVISAGVIMNLLFAFFVFMIGAMTWGVAQDPGPLLGGVNEEYLTPGSTGLAAVPAGSRIVAIGDRPIEEWNDIGRAIVTARAGETTFEFEGGTSVPVRIPSVDSMKGRLMSALEPHVAVPAVIGYVLQDGPADRGGLKADDRVVEAGGQPVESWQQLVTAIERAPGRALPLVVERGGQRVNLSITPEERLSHGLRYGRVGVGPAFGWESALPRSPVGPIRAVGQGAEQTWGMVTLTFDFLTGMITGRHSARNMGGVITIGQMSGRFMRAGFEEFLGFMAILSVNLAVLNLLPIPVLDGGHLVFLAIEAVRGRPLSIEQRMRLTQFGFIVIVAIMVWALCNDILRVFGI